MTGLHGVSKQERQGDRVTQCEQAGLKANNGPCRKIHLSSSVVSPAGLCGFQVLDESKVDSCESLLA